MSTEQINIRLDANVVSALERVAREDSIDRATAIRRLLEASLRQWEVDRAIESYRRGEASLGRAAEEGGLTQWELLDLLKRARVAYPLDADDVSARLMELESSAAAGEATLPDIRPKQGCILLVGINPAPVSVAAGHYYQGRLGQRLWRRLERIGLLEDPVPGREDEAFARAGHGLTDLVKRPTPSAAELGADEFAAGVQEFRRKLEAWRPGLILFAFKGAARRLMGSAVTPGPGAEFENVPTFLLTGPFAPTADAERIDGQLRSLLGLDRIRATQEEWTQLITPKDLERGQIRLKQPTRRLFPAEHTRVEIVLRGKRLDASYDPKKSPDRSRSPLLRVGREQLESLVQPKERLRVTRRLGGVVELS
jgi:double-stranded uracil-DNA glycosylase